MSYWVAVEISGVSRDFVVVSFKAHYPITSASDITVCWLPGNKDNAYPIPTKEKASEFIRSLSQSPVQIINDIIEQCGNRNEIGYGHKQLTFKVMAYGNYSVLASIVVGCDLGKDPLSQASPGDQQVLMFTLNNGNSPATNLYISRRGTIPNAGFVMLHESIIYADRCESSVVASLILEKVVSLELNNEERNVLHKACDEYMLQHNLKKMPVGFAMKSVEDGKVTPYTVIEFERLSGKNRLAERILVGAKQKTDEEPTKSDTVDDRLTRLKELVDRHNGFITLDYVATTGFWTIVVTRSTGTHVTESGPQLKSLLVRIESVFGLTNKDKNHHGICFKGHVANASCLPSIADSEENDAWLTEDAKRFYMFTDGQWNGPLEFGGNRN